MHLLIIISNFKVFLFFVLYDTVPYIIGYRLSNIQQSEHPTHMHIHTHRCFVNVTDFFKFNNKK